MEDLVVNVTLWGKEVGSLAWDDATESVAFEFDAGFLKGDLDSSPLKMPINRSRGKIYVFSENKGRCFNALPGIFADSLPDSFGNAIIDEWCARRGMPSSQFSALDRLCYIGKRGMGALEFEPSHSLPNLESSSTIHVGELIQLADDVLHKRESLATNANADNYMLDILKVGTSAGGAKPKAIIAYNKKTGEVRSGQVQAPEGFGYYLIKFDAGKDQEDSSSRVKSNAALEYVYYLLAKEAGIHMVETTLLEDGDKRHFLTKRFDRTEDGRKIHMATLAAIAHYDRDQPHSYEEAFRVMRTMKLPMTQQEEFYRRMVFNVMVKNHDDHTKNHSFLMNEKGSWSLSPAYDLSYAYSPDSRFIARHQMSLNGKRDNFVLEDVLSVGKNMDIKNPLKIVEEVATSIDRFSEFASDAGIEKRIADYVDREFIRLL